MNLALKLCLSATLALTACTDHSVRVSESELVGDYYSGDGLGVNITIALHDDGTFEGQWLGCLGDYGTSSGRWRLRGEQLVFEEQSSNDMMSGLLTEATTVRTDGRLGFVRAEDVQHGKVNALDVYAKRSLDSKPSTPRD